MIRQTVPAAITPIGEDEVELVLSTGFLARDGHVLVPQGCELAAYRANPVWLWSHDPTIPVGRCEAITVGDDRITAHMRFAPAGISAKADEIRGLVKAGIINAASVGFEPLDGEPLDPKKPRGGQRYTRWELLEGSFVAVPADPSALVTQRAPGTRDGGEGDYGDVEYADPGYQDDKKPRYPVDTPRHIKAAWSYIHKAGNREPYTAEQLKHIEGKITAAWKDKIDKDGPPSADEDERRYRPRVRKTRTTPRRLVVIRGMYGVGQLAYLLDMLGDAQRMAEWEREIEEDASGVPEMLTACLRDLGEALVAMTQEEVAELVGDDEPGDEFRGYGLGGAETALVMAATSPAVKRLRLGYFSARAAATAGRAGKALSAANAAQLDAVERHHARALEHHGDAGQCHDAIGDCQRGIAAAHERCRGAHDDLAPESAGDPADEHAPCRCARCMRAHRAMARGLDAIAEHNTGLGDEHEALGDAHRGIARSLRAANRCLRAVDGHEPAAQGADGDSQLIQSSGGTAEDEGARSREYRQRQAEKLRLAAI